MKSATESLIDFIISKKLDLEQYMTLVEPINELFIVEDKTGNKATVELVEHVIRWENGEQFYSLEETLKEGFFIKFKEKFILDKWKEGKQPDNDGMFRIKPDYVHSTPKENGK